MSFSSNQKDTSSTTTSTPDPMLASTLYGNVARAQTLADTPFHPYTGQQVAAFTPTQLQAQSALTSIANNQVGAAPLQAAINTAQGVAGYTPQMVSTQPLTSIDLGGYMNPFTGQVINTTVADLSRQQQIQDQADAAKATTAGAFGGSRSAVLQSLDRDNFGRQMASTVAGLNQANFSQAQAAAQNDLARSLTASQANQSAGLQGASLNLNAANALAGFGNQQLSQAQQWAASLSAAGDAQQKNQQDQLNAAYQQWQLAQQYPLQMQQLLNQTVDTLPKNYGTSNSSGSETGSSFGFGGSLSGSTGGINPLAFAIG
jgi:hypothetical protein